MRRLPIIVATLPLLSILAIGEGAHGSWLRSSAVATPAAVTRGDPLKASAEAATEQIDACTKRGDWFESAQCLFEVGHIDQKKSAAAIRRSFQAFVSAPAAGSDGATAGAGSDGAALPLTIAASPPAADPELFSAFVDWCQEDMSIPPARYDDGLPEPCASLSVRGPVAAPCQQRMRRICRHAGWRWLTGDLEAGCHDQTEPASRGRCLSNAYAFFRDSCSADGTDPEGEACKWQAFDEMRLRNETGGATPRSWHRDDEAYLEHLSDLDDSFKVAEGQGLEEDRVRDRDAVRSTGVTGLLQGIYGPGALKRYEQHCYRSTIDYPREPACPPNAGIENLSGLAPDEYWCARDKLALCDNEALRFMTTEVGEGGVRTPFAEEARCYGQEGGVAKGTCLKQVLDRYVFACSKGADAGLCAIRARVGMSGRNENFEEYVYAASVHNEATAKKLTEIWDAGQRARGAQTGASVTMQRLGSLERVAKWFAMYAKEYADLAHAAQDYIVYKRGWCEWPEDFLLYDKEGRYRPVNNRLGESGVTKAVDEKVAAENGAAWIGSSVEIARGQKTAIDAYVKGVELIYADAIRQIGAEDPMLSLDASLGNARRLAASAEGAADRLAATHLLPVEAQRDAVEAHFAAARLSYEGIVPLVAETREHRGREIICHNAEWSILPETPENPTPLCPWKFDGIHMSCGVHVNGSCETCCQDDLRGLYEGDARCYDALRASGCACDASFGRTAQQENGGTWRCVVFDPTTCQRR